MKLIATVALLGIGVSPVACGETVQVEYTDELLLSLHSGGCLDEIRWPENRT